MGPDQLAGVMEQIQRGSAKAKGVAVDEKKIMKEVKSFRDGVQRDSECYRTSGVLLDDGIINPMDTRDVLGMCLEVVNIPEVIGSCPMLARM